MWVRVQQSLRIFRNVQISLRYPTRSRWRDIQHNRSVAKPSNSHNTRLNYRCISNRILSKPQPLHSRVWLLFHSEEEYILNFNIVNTWRGYIEVTLRRRHLESLLIKLRSVTRLSVARDLLLVLLIVNRGLTLLSLTVIWRCLRPNTWLWWVHLILIGNTFGFLSLHYKVKKNKIMDPRK